MSNLKETTKQYYAERMSHVLEYIQANLDDPMSLDELAQIACFSPYHFHRIFSGMVGESVKSYIKRLRLERAAVTLKRRELSVTDIAFDAGFLTHESFTRAFSNMFGVSPQVFRKTNQSNIEHARVVFWKEVSMDVKVVELKDMNVAYVRHNGPYEECKPAWENLCEWAGGNGILKPSARFLSLCHDDPKITPREKIRHDACMEIDPAIEVAAPVAKKTIEAGCYAVTVHKGSYMNLAETYAMLCGQWAPQNGFEVDAKASIQIYLNNYNTTPAEDLLTEVYVPLCQP
ncbi:AraC family transcriptional regulator [Maridesulfovibrio sp.]|uniref:AraC family transcriptional regulator n=1 Tax=unclassified Maridesulfovibrio TaxID=2794999 RepID=UPI003B00F424